VISLAYNIDRLNNRYALLSTYMHSFVSHVLESWFCKVIESFVPLECGCLSRAIDNLLVC
jgi:hypothetical protein